MDAVDQRQLMPSCIQKCGRLVENKLYKEKQGEKLQLNFSCNLIVSKFTCPMQYPSQFLKILDTVQFSSGEISNTGLCLDCIAGGHSVGFPWLDVCNFSST